MSADAKATVSCAQALARVLPGNTRVFASPLQRCVQLAQALARLRPELLTSIDTRLVEMDFGTWEGWRWADIPKAAVDAWAQDFAHARFGGGESVQQLMERVASIHAVSRTSATPVVWLTHAGVVRAATLLERRVTQLQSADQWPVDGLDFGTWMIQCCQSPGAGRSERSG